MLMLAIERVRSSRPEVFYKKVFLKISQNLQENTCARIFINKETLAQVFSYEFCEIFKNTFSIEHFWGILVIERLRVGYMNTSLKIPLNLKSLTEEQ